MTAPTEKSNPDFRCLCPQVYCILSAIRERKKSFVFTDGSVVSLDSRVGFFITMNPGGCTVECHHVCASVRVCASVCVCMNCPTKVCRVGPLTEHLMT